MKFYERFLNLALLTPDEGAGGGITTPATHDDAGATELPVGPHDDVGDGDDDAMIDAAVAAAAGAESAGATDMAYDGSSSADMAAAAAKRDAKKTEPAGEKPAAKPGEKPAETPAGAAPAKVEPEVLSPDIDKVIEARVTAMLLKRDEQAQLATQQQAAQQQAPKLPELPENHVDIAQLREMAQYDLPGLMAALEVDEALWSDGGASLVHSQLPHEDVPADARMELRLSQMQTQMAGITKSMTGWQQQQTKALEQAQVAARHEIYQKSIHDYSTQIKAEQYPYVVRSMEKYGDGSSRIANEMYNMVVRKAEAGDQTVYSPQALVGEMNTTLQELAEWLVPTYLAQQKLSAGSTQQAAPVSEPQPGTTLSNQTAQASGGRRAPAAKVDPADMNDEQLIEAAVASSYGPPG